MRAVLRKLLPFIALTAVVLAVHVDPLVTGRVFYYRDLGEGMRPVLADAYTSSSGRFELLPLWTHAPANGRPLVANPGYAMLEPLDILYRILPIDPAFNLFLVLHVVIAAWGMAVLVRCLGAGGIAAFSAGAAYGLGGGMVSAQNLYWTAIAAAWAPWVIAAGIAAAREPTKRRVALLGIAVGLQLLGGQPELVASTLLVGVCASLAGARGRSLRRLGVTAGVWAAGVSAGCALAAPQLLAGILHARTTLRSFGFTPVGFLYNSLHPLRALWLVIPGLGGNPLDLGKPGGFPGAALLDTSSPYLLSIYLGLVTTALALAAVALLARRADKRALVLALAGVALAGVVIALGRFIPGVQALCTALHLTLPLRYPEKALYVTFLAVPPLAALGIDALRTFSPRFPRLPVLLAVMVVLDLLLAQLGRTPTIASEDLATPPPLARELIGRARALGIPDGLWRVHHEHHRSRTGWGPPAGSISPTVEDFYRWQVAMLTPPMAAPYGIHAAMDASSDQLVDHRYFGVMRALYTGATRDWALGLAEAGVLFVVSPRGDLESASEGLLVAEITLGNAQGVPPGSGFVYRNTRFLRRARLTADVSTTAGTALTDIPARIKERFAEQGKWPLPVAIEATGPDGPPAGGSAAEEGSVRAFAEDHSGLSVSVQAMHRCVLVVSDVPGDLRTWKAKVDGRAVPVWRANIAYLALPIEPGSHEVRLDYCPPGSTIGFAISLVTLVGLAVLIKAAVPRAALRS